jgi:hypothetical protein
MLHRVAGDGERMIIDLDSWEMGYADGRLGRSSECPANRDEVSYLSGYVQGRAARVGAGREVRLHRSIPNPRRLRFVR